MKWILLLCICSSCGCVATSKLVVVVPATDVRPAVHMEIVTQGQY